MTQQYGINNSNSKHIERENGILNRTKCQDGYIKLYLPEYGNSNKYGFIMEHRYIIEQHIGRFLNNNEVVHHINNIKDDNRLENLELMTKYNHQKLHNPKGKEHQNYKENAWNRRPRKEKNLKFEVDSYPMCNGQKQKRANHCMKCSFIVRRNRKNV